MRTHWSTYYLGNLLGMLNFMFKCSMGVVLMMWVRWTLPRLRIDQVMKTCLKYCTPIAAVMFLGAVIWKYELPGGLWLAPNPPLAETCARDGWSRGRRSEVGDRRSGVGSRRSGEARFAADIQEAR